MTAKPELKVFQMDDTMWLIGESLESCIKHYRDDYVGDDHEIDDAHEIPDSELDTLQYADCDEEENVIATRSFREQIALEAETGGTFPRVFACQDY